MYRPADLAPITKAEVVVLAKTETRSGEALKGFFGYHELSNVTVAGARAKDLAQLYRQLPDGMTARCHIPTFAIRFYQAEKLLLEGSFCWTCHNFYGEQKGEAIHFAFDAQHPQAQVLRQRFIALTGHDPATP